MGQIFCFPTSNSLNNTIRFEKCTLLGARRSHPIEYSLVLSDSIVDVFLLSYYLMLVYANMMCDRSGKKGNRPLQ